MKDINLDKMCFTEFVEHLEEKDIRYTVKEEVNIDMHFTVVTIVTPYIGRVRYFDNDGGIQLINQPKG